MQLKYERYLPNSYSFLLSDILTIDPPSFYHIFLANIFHNLEKTEFAILIHPLKNHFTLITYSKRFMFVRRKVKLFSIILIKFE